MKTFLIFPLLVAASSGYAQAALSATDALALAAKNRPALQAAKLKISEARSAALGLGAYPSSTFGIGASSRSEVGATDQDLFLNQPIDLFGRRHAGRAVGKAGVQLAIAEYSASVSALQGDVLTAYANTVASHHQKEVADELLRIAEGLSAATKRRFDEGKVAEIQVTRASIELERAKQAAALRDADLAASLRRLAGLLGTEVSMIRVAPDATIEPLSSPGVSSRPDLLLLNAQVQIAESEAETARFSNRPELSLQLVRSPWGESRGYFVGRAQITWTFFDDGRARSETKAARLKAESACKLLDDTTLTAKAEVEAAQIEVDARQSRIRSYEAILASARDLVAKSQRGYTEGYGIQTDVLEAARALREVEQELVEARHQLSLAVIAQYRASGFLAEVLK